MKKRVKMMNIKWMSLVAAITVFSAGCSDSEQESTNKQASGAVVPMEVEVVEVKEVIEITQTPEQKAALKKVLSSVEGIPPEKLDSEVKGLIAKISENSEMTEEEAAKLEQDLKRVFQKIEAERVQ